MKTGTIQNLIRVLEQAFIKLNSDFIARDIEYLAVSIHRILSVEARSFHTPEHILSLTDPDAPVQSLAAVFHDLIYYQVDQGFPASVYTILAPHLVKTEEGNLIVGNKPVVDRTFELLQDLFAIPPGQAISVIIGVNEFLSALVAWKKLEHLLPESLLLKISVHIEATIPFRGPDDLDLGHFDTLALRMKNVCQKYGIAISAMEVDETIFSAVKFANKDVAGFAHPSAAVFLDNTWKLLPEINAELRSGRIYSIREYRQALQKMESFFAWLEPQNIFHSYKGVPSEQELQKMIAAAYRNIDIAREYLGLKLLAIAILEALAETTGGDTPMTLFMGDIQAKDEGQQRLENFLPEIDISPSHQIDSTVYSLLADGRSGQSLFDLQNSPLALFLYASLGSDGCRTLLSNAREMLVGKRTPHDFLVTIDPSVLSAVTHACAQMVPTRREMLNRIISAHSSE